MAKKRPPTSPPDPTKVGGGWKVGDKVTVSGLGATHHGDRGVVVDFCKNGSKINVYVQLEKNGRSRVSVGNLSYDQSGTESTDNTETQSVDVSEVSIKTGETRNVPTWFETLESCIIVGAID